MRNILFILTMFFLAFFWSCTACNSNDQKNDTDSFAINDAEADTDSVKKDEDINDSVDSSDKEIDNDAFDESEAPDLSNDPYVKYYPDYDKNIAY